MGDLKGLIESVKDVIPADKQAKLVEKISKG